MSKLIPKNVVEKPDEHHEIKAHDLPIGIYHNVCEAVITASNTYGLK